MRAFIAISISTADFDSRNYILQHIVARLDMYGWKFGNKVIQLVDPSAPPAIYTKYNFYLDFSIKKLSHYSYTYGDEEIISSYEAADALLDFVLENIELFNVSSENLESNPQDIKSEHPCKEVPLYHVVDYQHSFADKGKVSVDSNGDMDKIISTAVDIYNEHFKKSYKDKYKNYYEDKGKYKNYYKNNSINYY